MKLLLFLFSISIFFNVFNFANNSHFNNYKLAYKKNNFFPLMNKEYQFSSIQNSYIQQKNWIDFLTSEGYKNYGYKSSLTTKSEQEFYNINNPIFGVILSQDTLYNFDIIYKKDYLKPYITIKLGVKLKKDITKKIENSYDLKDYIMKIYPIVEITDYKFKNLNNITYNDLIVSNLGLSQFIKGDRIYFKDIRKLNISINHQSENNILIKKYTSEQILNQLKWIINRALTNNWEIKKGDIIFSSPFNKKIKAKKGIYRVDFISYSSILFEIR